ncbi:hypothetical protein [Paenibacillus hunanensis]|uniref:Conjugal transfer protein TrbC n=1 Tax=Paenibacillus hunanensis TaxID=539262 RepID=A0ABU1IX00_9BACL|nr:hypothetical protein [Paenibacillus hunanensis]MDR6243451.1 hypothetical protein [Paenibacillus hunanensis]GGI97824.1 hypothetical protein GCM10008022_03150 [Paenibacillus hunanensis]
MQMMFKACSVLIVLLALLTVVEAPALVYAETKGTTGTSIKDKLTNTTNGLENQVDKSTNNFVDSARHIFIFGALVFGFWLGACFWGAGFSPDILRQTKIQSLAFIACMAMIFWTEPILGFIFGIFGVDIATIMS